VVGHLKWQVIDARSNKVLAEGDRDIALNEVDIVEKTALQGGSYFDKAIDLGDHFSIAIAEHPEGRKVGFGLMGQREDEQTFSWEWFNVDGPSHATKIQEGGELGIKIKRTQVGPEIVYTEFLTDVSLRVLRFSLGIDPRDPDWRINIARGSYVTWPSKVKGEVVAN
jgi:hypothetical protein